MLRLYRPDEPDECPVTWQRTTEVTGTAHLCGGTWAQVEGSLAAGLVEDQGGQWDVLDEDGDVIAIIFERGDDGHHDDLSSLVLGQAS